MLRPAAPLAPRSDAGPLPSAAASSLGASGTPMVLNSLTVCDMEEDIAANFRVALNPLILRNFVQNMEAVRGANSPEDAGKGLSPIAPSAGDTAEANDARIPAALKEQDKDSTTV